MKEVITLWSNLFSLFFSNLSKEINHFFERPEDPLSSSRNQRQHGTGGQKDLYKIPRLGR